MSSHWQSIRFIFLLVSVVLTTVAHSAEGHWLHDLQMVSVFQLVNAPSDSQVLYAGTAIGIFKSSDGGISWPQEELSLHGFSVTALVVDPRNADVVYATDTNHVYKTVDGGQQWTNILNGTGSNFSLTPLRLAPDNADIVFAGADFKSTNQGRNWVINTHVLGHDVGPVLTAMTVTPDLSVFVGIAQSSMWRDSIGPAQHPFCSITKGDSGMQQQAFGLAALRTSYPSGVFRKQEDGLGWCRVNLPLDDSAQITVLEYRAASGSEQSNVLWVETSQGVFQSRDEGDSWTETSHLIIPTEIPNARPSLMYGVIDNNPVWSQEGSNSWETFNLNLPIGSSRSLMYLPGRKVFLSAGADGIFTSHKPESLSTRFKFRAESPAANVTVSGISTVHGWAFSTQPGVSIQQVSFDPFDIPCCSQRNDVAAAFPDYPTASASGWGMAINWSDLPEGNKNIRYKVRDSSGEMYISRPQSITVARLAGASFLDQFDLAQASAEINDNRVLLKQVSVRDKATGTVSLSNVQLHWSAAN